jgi:hypothetical protein
MIIFIRRLICMDTVNKPNDLGKSTHLIKQELLFRDIAAGMGLSKSAKQRGYSTTWACNLARSPTGQARIAAIRLEVEQLMAENLVELVTQAIIVLRASLNSPFADNRFKAAELILKPMLAMHTLNANANESHNPPILPEDKGNQLNNDMDVIYEYK